MELAIQKSALVRMLNRAASAAAVKSPLLILNTVLLEAADGVLKTRATDTQVGVDMQAEAKVKTPGAVCAEAKKLANIVREMPEGDITIKSIANGIEIRSGKAARFKLPTMPAEDFPTLPTLGDQERIKVSAEELLRALSQVDYAVCSDETRPQMAGVHFDTCKEGLCVVATDGHRMAKAECEATGSFGCMTVPTRGASELKRLCADADGDVEFAAFGGRVFFVSQSETLSVKLTDEQFPPYKRVIPASHAHEVILSKDMLLSALKRVRLATRHGKDNKGNILLPMIHVDFAQGQVSFTAEDAVTSDEAFDAIECDSDFDLRIGACVTYLIDAVSSIRDDEVRLQVTGALDPIKVVPASSGECTAIVMPSRT